MRVNGEIIRQIKQEQKLLVSKRKIESKPDRIFYCEMMWSGYEYWKQWLIKNKDEVKSFDEVTATIKKTCKEAIHNIGFNN